MVILVFFLVISVNRRLFRYFGSYSGISLIPVILVNRRTADLGTGNGGTVSGFHTRPPKPDIFSRFFYIPALTYIDSF